MKKQAFLFDMDGTIVDNMDFHARAWHEFFRRRGTVIDEEAFFRDTAGRQNHEIMRTYIDPGLSDADCASLGEEKEDIYRELYSPHRTLAPGFPEFIRQARNAGIVTAVATAAPASNVQFILDEMGIRPLFDVVVGAADVARGKPHPDVFLAAAERCSAAPAQCIVFEDAPLGVEAAQRAGMRAVVLSTTAAHSAFDRFNNVIAIGADFAGFDVRRLADRAGQE
jgi:beta-phosphoglucomutase family hydrolase